MREFAGGLEGPEGPIALDDGSVLVVEGGAGALTRVGAEGDIDRLAECGGRPRGAALGPGGKVFLCNRGDPRPAGVRRTDAMSGRIQIADMLTGEISDLYTMCDGRRLGSPCDLVFDRFGGFYFTDSSPARDGGGIFYARDDGSRIHRLDVLVDRPAGIGLSPTGSHLHVAESPSGRILTWAIGPPGVLGEMSLFGVVPGLVRLASLAVELHGAVAVATNPAGPDAAAGVTVLDPTGGVVEFVGVGRRNAVTNLCFGGADLRTVYVSTLGSDAVCMERWDRPGLSLVSEPTAAD
jgi:gluconolactonase